MQIREKKKFDLKHNVELFKDIHPLTMDQAFYDKEFRTWHIKILIGLGLVFTALFVLILNARIFFI